MGDTATVPEFEGFDWSGGNAEKNWERHRVTPLEAEQVFFNTPLLQGTDPAHSEMEKRFYALGQTDEGRELFITFTMRGRRLRVVSARAMSRKERRVYRS
ncbi:MAG: BrnT family toxin [Lentisphaerae bacterium]|nr:BrnT family toxin [Lentisphaerota bacterium]